MNIRYYGRIKKEKGVVVERQIVPLLDEGSITKSGTRKLLKDLGVFV